MVEFEWDVSNTDKVRRHGLDPFEVEESFYDPRRRPVTAKKSDPQEQRYGITGRTDAGRLITAFFIR